MVFLLIPLIPSRDLVSTLDLFVFAIFGSTFTCSGGYCSLDVVVLVPVYPYIIVTVAVLVAYRRGRLKILKRNVLSLII